MTGTVKELRRLIEDISEQVEAEHGKKTPYCEVLHVELGVPQTPKDDADTIVERLHHEHPEIDLDEASIKLTVEHEEVHELLNRFVVDSMMKGADAAQLAALMLVIGRRMGMREASMLLGGDEFGPLGGENREA